MKHTLSRWLPAFLAISVLAFVLGGCGGSSDPGKTVHVTTKTFAEEVTKAPGLVLVDFWAPWCAPCRAIAPSLKELADTYDGRVKICKVNIDQEPKLAAALNVRSIPALLLFKDGAMVDLRLGARDKAYYASWIEEHL